MDALTHFLLSLDGDFLWFSADLLSIHHLIHFQLAIALNEFTGAVKLKLIWHDCTAASYRLTPPTSFNTFFRTQYSRCLSKTDPSSKKGPLSIKSNFHSSFLL